MQAKLVALIISLFLSASSQATIISKSFPSLTGWYEYYDSQSVSFDLGVQFSSITSAVLTLTAQSREAQSQQCVSYLSGGYFCSTIPDYPKAFYRFSSESSTDTIVGSIVIDSTSKNTTGDVLSETDLLLDGKGTLLLAHTTLELLSASNLSQDPVIEAYDVTLTIDGTLEAYIPEEPRLTFLDILYLYTIDKIADQNGFDHWNDIYNELYSRLNVIVSPTDSATKVTLDLLQSQPFLNLQLSNSDFIVALHEMLYDRAPDQDELNSWTQALEAGESREMVAYDFLRSQEFKDLSSRFDTTAFNEDDNALFQLKSFVQRFYQLVLGREPDRDGFKYWSSQLANNSGAGRDIAKGFFQSSEFINRQTTDSEFLDIVYHAFFNRDADSEGKNYWINEMSIGKSRLDIINGFSGSQEFSDLASSFGIAASSDDNNNLTQIQGFVKRFYQLVLSREPDTDGLNYWSSQLVDGTETGGDIARGFFESSEFINRQTADSEFLDIVYRSFFNRESDAEGKRNWMGELSFGANRLIIINGFIGSQEFIDLTNQFGIKAD